MGAPAEPPLIAGTIHGVRTWSLAIHAGEPTLTGRYKHVPWRPAGATTSAECHEAHHGPNELPMPDCGCGLYGLHLREDAFQEVLSDLTRTEPADACAGLIEAWGRVEVHRSGFRAQYARPAALFLPAPALGSGYESTVRRLADAYGADIVVVRDADDLARHCAGHELGLSRGAVDDLLGREEAAEPESSGGLPRPPRRRERVLNALGLALAGVWYLFVAAMVGAVAVGVVGAILDGEDPPPPAAPGPPLEVLDTRIGTVNGGVLYVTRVRNESRARAALDVGLTGRLVDATGERIAGLQAPRTKQPRLAILPGATAVVVGWVERTPGRAARMRAGVGGLALRGAVARAGASEPAPGAPRIVLGEAGFDRESCTLTARVRSSEPVRSARVQAVRFEVGRPAGFIYGQAGPLGPKPAERALVRLLPGDCRAAYAEDFIEVYPSLRSAEIANAVPAVR